MTHHALSSRALPRWHSSTITRSKNQLETLGETFAPLVFGKSLIDSEVHFSAFDDLARIDFETSVTERSEDSTGSPCQGRLLRLRKLESSGSGDSRTMTRAATTLR